VNREPEFDSGNKALTDQKFWNETWESENVSHLVLGKLEDRQKELINYLKPLRFNQNRRILEVGVGPGVKLYELAGSLNLEPWGLDFSETACRLARQNALANGIAAVIIRGNIFSPPFSPGGFGITLSQGVIEHFVNPLEILRQCSELVAPGGYLITTIPNIGGFCGLLMKSIDPDNFKKHIVINLTDLRFMYAELKLEVVFSGPLGGFYIPYYPKVKSFIIWFFLGIIRKILPLLLNRLNFKSEYFSSELLIIGEKVSNGY
jgi:SAM-dependent methyltransferase